MTAAASRPAGQAALEMRGISKTFAGVTVLRAVDLTVGYGEIHGLIGQNGSGKSTLIKILAGYHVPDPGGRVSVDGRPVSLPVHPQTSAQRGLAFVHQDLALAESLSVLDNLLLAKRARQPRLRIRWAAERRWARALLERFGMDRDPETPVRRLTQAERTICAIVRGLAQLEQHGGGGVMILDEPTGQLPEPEVARLFEAIRTVRDSGASAVFVGHRLDEILALTDSVSVLRDGQLVGTVTTAETDEQELIELLLGHGLADVYPDRGVPREEVVLSVRDLAGGAVAAVDLDLHAGEILGVTGLLGMGYDEVPYLVTGAQPLRTGTVVTAGRPIRPLSPRAALQAGIALLPGDRQRQGSMQTGTVMENVTLPTIGRYFSGGRLRHRRERRDVRALLERFDVRPPDPARVMRSLSGGNQQKALIAKWLTADPRVLVLHEPTHGVDVGARSQIFQLIKQASDDGTAVLLCSAEHEDLARLCQRVLILREGRVVSELTGDELTEDRIVEASHMAQSIGSATPAPAEDAGLRPPPSSDISGKEPL